MYTLGRPEIFLNTVFNVTCDLTWSGKVFNLFKMSKVMWIPS